VSAGRGRSPLAQRSDGDDYARIFKALSEPLRVQMISLFDADGSCACTLLETSLPVSKSTISYHVKILSEAGLIEVRKDGRFYHYDLRRDVFEYFVPGFLERIGSDAAAP
jgi:ArsR family transcriptional regulator